MAITVPKISSEEQGTSSTEHGNFCVIECNQEVIEAPDATVIPERMRQSAKKILQQTDIDKLPSLPQSLLSLLEICTCDSLPTDQLAALLRHDPALHLRVCAAMHHAGISHDESGATLIESLQYLDRSRLRSIATNASTMQFFSRINRERTEFIKSHWRHSLLCAHVAEHLCGHTDYPYPEEVYKAGQLHDIGQLILEGAYPDTYTHTFAKLSEDEYFHDLELEQFKTTHQEVGAECLRKHGCDPFISDACLYHHENTTTLLDAHPIVKLVYIANLLTSEHFDEKDPTVFEAAEVLLGLAKPLLMDALKQSHKQVDTIAEEMEIEIPEDGVDGDTYKQIASREQNKQLKLAEQVRNIALLDSLHQTFSYDGELDIETIIREQCQLLFGIGNCLLFIHHADDNRLHANTITTHNHLNEVAIPLDAGRSQVTDAILENRIIDSFDTDYTRLSVIDKQLIDLYAGKGSICIPMLLDNTPIGTIVLVVNEVEHEQVNRQKILLKQFAQALSHIISSPQSGILTSQSGATDDTHSRLREIAHEIRNPLSIINNYLEVLSYKLESDNPAQEDITTIKSEINRIGDIIRNMTDRSVTQDETADTDINGLLSDLTSMMSSALPAERNIEFKLSLDKELVRITTNANALKQIYTNLVKNAIEALPANGSIMVYTQDNVNVDGEPFIEISVSDDGPGIPSDILPNLFSPVDTTKQGEHAGLGLTIVKNLVNELHGSIRCRSSERGTEFSILLPKR